MAQSRHIKTLPPAKLVEHFSLTNMGVLELHLYCGAPPVVRNLLVFQKCLHERQTKMLECCSKKNLRPEDVKKLQNACVGACVEDLAPHCIFRALEFCRIPRFW